MDSRMLSQAEIDALLNISQEQAPVQSKEDYLTGDEKDALGEIGNISMGTAATTMSLLLDRRVQITIPKVTITTPREISEASPMPFVIVEVEYVEGLVGRNLLVIRMRDGSVIADLMMGRDGLDPQDEIDDFVLSALSEAMNQMMGSAATSLSSMFNRTVVISPPTANVIDLGVDPLHAQLDSDEPLVKIAFSMTVENLIDSEVMLLLGIDFAGELLALLAPSADEEPAVMPSPTTAASPAPTPSPMPRPRPQPAPPASGPPVGDTAPKRVTSPPAVQVQSVEFQSLPDAASPSDFATGNLQLLLDIPLQLTVELGRTHKTIKEVLELVPGSIFELDRVAGEPVDICVNNKLIAKGEVVVIDENFGVRITDIVSVANRVANLQ